MAQDIWTDVFDWPIIGLHAVLTPDNKVLTYGTDQYGVQGGDEIYDVWDFETGTHYTLPSGTMTDLFCTAGAYIPATGQILLMGGDARPHGAPNGGVHDVNVYDPMTMTISPLMTGDLGGGMGGGEMAAMHYERWYPTAVTLANGKIVSIGGSDMDYKGVGTPEFFDPNGGWKELPGAHSDYVAMSPLYPRSFLASDGDIYMFEVNALEAWVSNVMRMDPSGNGRIENVGKLPFTALWSDPAIKFEEDKVLFLASNGDCWIMDMSGPLPTFQKTGGLGETRHWSNMVVLADGSVMLSGGSAVANELTGVTNDVQIWNPATGQWTEGADAAVARLYHSTTILLPDATVLSLGGGAPGPLQNLNGEIYKPAYLFNEDGTLADRPVITDAPETLEQQENFTITVDDAASIDRLTLIKYGSVTHSLNMGTDKIELTFTVGPNNTLNVQVPTNANVFTPGNWMLFAINDKGTPSVAAKIEVGVGGEYHSEEIGGYLTLNGFARYDAPSDTFELTPLTKTAIGGVMSNERVDLTKDFDITFNFLHVAKNGGEGLAFVLHNDPFGGDAFGTGGGKLGAYGIGKGLGIEFDTKNDGAGYGDINQLHTNFFDTDKPNAAQWNVTTPVAMNGQAGQWHYVQVSWDAALKQLTYWIDGVQAGTINSNIAMQFLGSQSAYFGFTGSTGAIGDVQKVKIVGLDATYEDGDYVSTNLALPGAKIIYGSRGEDSLTGTAGSDTIIAQRSNDVVLAGFGNDTIDCGKGADVCYGQGGNDVLFGQYGNDFLSGVAGNDTLCGGQGKDQLFGYEGNDTFLFRALDGDDVCNGGTGFDTANFSAKTMGLTISLLAGTAQGPGFALTQLVSIENVVGGSGNDVIIGSNIGERLDGGAGNDRLAGGLGNDKLMGGAGRDSFIFNTKLNGGTNADTILDFNPVYDTIQLNKAIFSGIAGKGLLTQGQFVVGTGASQADDHIIYNKANGALLYDADGAGGMAAIKFATVAPNTALTHTDFFIA